MYRPEGMRENPYLIPEPRGFYRYLGGREIADIYQADRTLVEKHEAFEAGADAMLEGLKKQPGTKRIQPKWGYSDKDGSLVFIPEEE